MADWRIPLSDLDYGLEEEAAALRVLRSRWLSAGPEVHSFEAEFSARMGVGSAVAVSNGTAALHLALLALGLGPGDEVIQPAINFVAAANMTVAVGATPVFADILDLDEPTIDPADIESKITNKTKAVVVMHYGGYLCRMSAIKAICGRYGIALIEDACHAVGAPYETAHDAVSDGKVAGSIGDIGCFSFFSNKNLATGEGGMVVTTRPDLAQRMRNLRSHGMTTLTWDRHRGHANTYDVILNGYNYRLDDLRAALGRAQLAKLDTNNAKRRQLISLYCKELKLTPGWLIPFVDRAGSGAAHLMVLVAPTQPARGELMKLLADNRIQTSIHYPCIPRFSAFRSYASCSVDRSQAFASRALTLPLFPGLACSNVREICSIVNSLGTHSN